MKRYYYLTIHVPYRQKSSLHPEGEPDSKLGWHKCWSDITEDGIFAVYRKEMDAAELVEAAPAGKEKE